MSEMEEAKQGGSPRALVAGLMALLGGVFFAVLLGDDVENFTGSEWADLPTALIVRYLVAMALGGALAGWLLAGMFGRGGIGGWAFAAIGGVLATCCAGLFGSAVGLLPDLLANGWQMADLIPILFGLLVVPLAMAARPFLALGWVVLIVVTHLLAKRRRGG
ncbi:hypothetical protein R3X27_04570 [Tropicimonas sp. TH_r6]|uniref:hypothetical protein n=1 Tax=Tropicimonas sp. TH_r6 TaxID=3082085 RepID=UPI002954EB4F|nr:hypothetical protein [Tropicimonas sp. TH_r6]MDV7141952.1 hypothetical protein [Tropicimonas sp. TH_r6]